jgi:hypothetical protein
VRALGDAGPPVWWLSVVVHRQIYRFLVEQSEVYLVHSGLTKVQ